MQTRNLETNLSITTTLLQSVLARYEVVVLLLLLQIIIFYLSFIKNLGIGTCDWITTRDITTWAATTWAANLIIMAINTNFLKH
jgi:hypothetical protein